MGYGVSGRLPPLDYLQLLGGQRHLGQCRVLKMCGRNLDLERIKHGSGDPDMNPRLSVADLALVDLLPQTQHLFANVAGVD